MSEEQFIREQDARLQANLSKIRNKLIVISGKGGVGKTTVSVNLAYGLAMNGYKVGLLDIDMHGPNIMKMLGADDKRMFVSPAGEIAPIEVLPDLKAVSISSFLDSPDDPVIWRGPIKMATIKQLLADVQWGELDYLIIDSPPGTGDEPLSVCQLITDINGAIVVTTPQDVAVLDSRKSISFARKLRMPIIGVIENMSGLICPHCKGVIELFSSSGGEKAADDMQVPFLGRVPLEPEIVKAADKGEPFVKKYRDTEAGNNLCLIMDRVVNYVESL